MKHAIFSTETDLMEMMQSDPFTFDSCYSNTPRSLRNPLTLTIAIVSGVRVHKTVVNAERGAGTHIKGVDVLPNWVISTDTKHYYPAVGSAQAMITDWEDGSNRMFSFKPGSKEEAVFKNSKRGACIKNLPKFSNVPSSHLVNTLSSSPFALTPMGQAFDLVLKHVPAGVMKCVDANLIQFVKNYKEDSKLLGHKLWDEHFRNQISAELEFCCLKKTLSSSKPS